MCLIIIHGKVFDWGINFNTCLSSSNDISKVPTPNPCTGLDAANSKDTITWFRSKYIIADHELTTTSYVLVASSQKYLHFLNKFQYRLSVAIEIFLFFQLFLLLCSRGNQISKFTTEENKRHLPSHFFRSTLKLSKPFVLTKRT